VVERAVTSPEGLRGEFELTEDAYAALIAYASGDARRALTALDAGCAVANGSGRFTITAADVESGAQHKGVRYDKDGDMHYDVISAYIKSLRGSDVDAALHYLARMIVAGEDPRFIARRLIVHASEDVGMADPTALRVAVAAANTVALIGMPEARIALAQATIHIALAPKSNAVITAIDSAIADVERGNIGEIPAHLRDAHYPGAKALGHGIGYRYPHDYPGAVVAQQYLPDTLADRAYYEPGRNGVEAKYAEAWQTVRGMVRNEL
jgi:putative ATPase